MKTKKNAEEVMAAVKPDRRLLSNVPDSEGIRANPDRRGQNKLKGRDRKADAGYTEKLRALSLRYSADFDVMLTEEGAGKGKKIKGRSVDLSASGMLVELDDESVGIETCQVYRIKFFLPSGLMPEGFESKVDIRARAVRIEHDTRGDRTKGRVGFEFEETLMDYFGRKKWRYSVYSASLFLFLAVFTIILMRMESILYYKQNIVLYTYSLITALFLLSRYFFGALYRSIPVNPDFTPGVSIIISCFNEEKWIRKTILGCVDQDYPLDKLEVIVVDDGSTDDSPQVIMQTLQDLHKVAGRYKTKERVKAVLLKKNGGKRRAIIEGVKLAKHDLVVFVDSDSFLEPTAIKNLVQPFQDPKMGGVTGRTDVANIYTNFITKMQAVRYYIAFRIMKAAESYFDCVTCLSGPLSCYRKELVLKNADEWINQKFLGQPATFGDDRSMTNFIIRTHRTGYQDKAICSTVVPSKMSLFLKQQMRWKRSWLRESLRASTIVPRKEPFMALFFYMGLLVPVLAPVVFTYNLIYVPIFPGIFPTTFILGFLLMSLLMSFSYMLFQKSNVWSFGMIFCIFYELVLLWQMPVAWFTFWKSTWGTRDTPEDVEHRRRKMLRKKKGPKAGGNYHAGNGRSLD